jgi:hypothetical protein
MLGFKTIGNATLICFDDDQHPLGPVLITDPWLPVRGDTFNGSAYFGSWALSHEVPTQELEEILNTEYVWISHGHPDHLNGESIDLLKNKKILLPNHVGNRIYDHMQTQGFNVSVLPDRRWTTLSENIRVYCVSDYFQDAVLLVDINGRLVVNLNDAADRAWGSTIRKIIRRYKTSYLLKMGVYGDTDMINFYDEAGNFIIPECARKGSIGAQLSTYANLYGTTHLIPFSSFHKYQRSDSVWANAYTTPVSAVSEGYSAKRCDLLPPYVEVDCVHDRVREINPQETPELTFPPEFFGDNWSDRLEKDDVVLAQKYFQAKEALQDHFGFICVRVGGEDHVIPVNPQLKTGITFEAPRNSLVTALKYEIFDDMLIGNFMKTVLHGVDSLYPSFSPYVGKYADNGRAQSKEELDRYFEEYRKRSALEFIVHQFETESERIFRRFISRDSMMFNLAKQSYVMVKGRRS